METPEMKPCPFCGSSKFLDGTESPNCAVCDALGPDGNDEENAVQLWNTRASDAEIARLKAEVADWKNGQEALHRLNLANASRVAELEEALEWYASTDRYHYGMGDLDQSEAEMDEGQRARKALAQRGEGEGSPTHSWARALTADGRVAWRCAACNELSGFGSTSAPSETESTCVLAQRGEGEGGQS